jgi:helicase required for RNAi-mediated heterochromatin assembly 1
MDHEFYEKGDQVSMSKSNPKEAELVVRFAHYLLKQNILPSGISILSLYAGQLMLIKRLINEIHDRKLD